MASIGRAEQPAATRGFIGAVRHELPDATHHCWALITGAPGDTRKIGLSNAGEPRGTAERPILDVLLDSGFGEIVVVVTRYFGGKRLGRGGLTRAYSGAVAHALETLDARPKAAFSLVRMRVPCSAAESLFRFQRPIGTRREGELYAADVTGRARVPPADLERLARSVAELASGSGEFDALDRFDDRPS